MPVLRRRHPLPQLRRGRRSGVALVTGIGISCGPQASESRTVTVRQTGTVQDVTLAQMALLARQLRVDSIRANTSAGSGHPTSSLSAADLAMVLLARHLRYDWQRPDLPTNGHLIFSKGHALRSPPTPAALRAAGGPESARFWTSERADGRGRDRAGRDYRRGTPVGRQAVSVSAQRGAALEPGYAAELTSWATVANQHVASSRHFVCSTGGGVTTKRRLPRPGAVKPQARTPPSTTGTRSRSRFHHER